MAKRFRAYSAGIGKEGYYPRNEDGSFVLDEDGNKVRAFHEWPVEEVAFEGRATDGKAQFDAGDTKITRVVFYDGPAGEETVVGEVAVNASGSISAELPAKGR